MLPSHKQGLYTLEHCKVRSHDDRLVYEQEEGNHCQHFSLPIENTSALLLGPGTSLTQAAAKKLANAGVLVAFTGGGGTPLFFASQNEYRPTQWCQGWWRMWADEPNHLQVAKQWQAARAQEIGKQWKKTQTPKPAEAELLGCLEKYTEQAQSATDKKALLGAEGNFTRKLYGLWSRATQTEGFRRESGKKQPEDKVNSFLDQGNYLAYGLAGVALWVLGIPHSMPVLHGETRRGALVFDVADLVKDAIVLPWAFTAAAEGLEESEFRKGCVQRLHQAKTLDLFFKALKQVAQ